jgi:hypothetical protein
MHSAQMTFGDEQDPADEEPTVLSYTQFRNHLGLLDWRRRRAEYERHSALPAALRPQGNISASTNRR